MSEQMQLSLIVPLMGQPIPARLDVLEMEMCARLKAQFGLSRSAILKRAVQLVRLETAMRGGSTDFLFNPERLKFPNRVRPPTSGRKSRAQKISDLEKSIVANLRAAESQRLELEALKQRSAA